MIVILVDDMGYGDIAAHGNPITRTPHLDKLHSESIRLTDFHVDPTCSPTRAALMTGRYPHRVGVWHTIAGGNHLRIGEITMADVFKANGYRTGMFGKWHLGSNFPYRPMDRGFDTWLGQGDGGTGSTDDMFLNDRVNDHYLSQGEWKKIDGWGEEVFFHAAMDFIRDSKKAGKPFFTYLCTYSPHTPITLPEKNPPAPHLAKIDRGSAFFHASIERIDSLIGKLRSFLDDEGLDRDTMMVFLTDNGGTMGVSRFNAGMRERKGSVYEGGHRVPCFIHWPGGGWGQARDVSSLHAHIDLLPTFVDLCQLKLPHPVDFDGRSFRDLLTNPAAQAPERTLMVEVQRTYVPQKNRAYAAMSARWRLINGQELYDLKTDPRQNFNLLYQHPEVASRLMDEYERYWLEVSPGDRERPIAIAGDPRDPETFLHSSDWYLPSPPWNHQLVAQGPRQCGTWWMRVAKPGNYVFEARRWPREAAAPLAGVPEIRKTIDSWDARGGKPGLIYGGPKPEFKALPVASVRLTVGRKVLSCPVTAEDDAARFEIELQETSPFEVKAELLDADGKTLAGAYYVYCRKLDS